MTGSTISRPRGGGIRKQRQKRDRDGDITMGGPKLPQPQRAARATGSGRSRDSHTAPFTELRVTGWTEEKEVGKIINFLDRHAARRSHNIPKGSVPVKMVKRHQVSGTVLKIWIRPEDVTPFNKINGFTFSSENGTQKLTISGPGIRNKSPNRPKSPNAMEVSADGKPAADKAATMETEKMLEGFLARRYDPAQRLLNLSKIADDEEVTKSGMFADERTQKKFFPALMIICDRLLESAEEKKRETIMSVTLSDNNLPNLDVVRTLATTLPHIKNLDLSGNNFANTRALKPWKNRFRSLEQLIIVVGEPEWEEELISWYPKLRFLNGQRVRPDPPEPAVPAIPAVSAPEPVAILPTLSAEQEEMIATVMRETNLKREMAVQCLEAGLWNYEQAGDIYARTKDTLTPDMFNS